MLFHAFHASLILILALLAALSGCGGDVEYKAVDFSKNYLRCGAQREEAAGKVLRWPVAAMISPKETFIYYRELLDYIGRNTGTAFSSFSVNLLMKSTSFPRKGRSTWLSSARAFCSLAGKIRVRGAGDSAGARAAVLSILPDRPQRQPLSNP